ncbi:MAG TPA: hypothetical protein PKD49_07230 [Hyphomicrobium sp.]|nr:hypothetical protein [Hyphomicrobium sp.]
MIDKTPPQRPVQSTDGTKKVDKLVPEVGADPVSESESHLGDFIGDVDPSVLHVKTDFARIARRRDSKV